MEFDGMSWFFHNRNAEINISGISIAPGRFYDIVLDNKDKKYHKISNYLSKNPSSRSQLSPYHFGYDNHSALLEYHKYCNYLILTKRDKSIYKDVYPTMADFRWNLSDFKRIDEDPDINKLYMNNDLNIRYICTWED